MIGRVCNYCHLFKLSSELLKGKTNKFGLRKICRLCHRKREAIRYHTDPKFKAYQLDWGKRNYRKHKRKIIAQKIKYQKLNPWVQRYCGIKARCENKREVAYKYYGKKGIRALITSKEIKELWFRDKAHLMRRPSIDRINSRGNYEFSNCRFIELSDNVKRRFLPQTPNL